MLTRAAIRPGVPLWLLGRSSYEPITVPFWAGWYRHSTGDAPVSRPHQVTQATTSTDWAVYGDKLEQLHLRVLQNQHAGRAAAASSTAAYMNHLRTGFTLLAKTPTSITTNNGNNTDAPISEPQSPFSPSTPLSTSSASANLCRIMLRMELAAAHANYAGDFEAVEALQKETEAEMNQLDKRTAWNLQLSGALTTKEGLASVLLLEGKYDEALELYEQIHRCFTEQKLKMKSGGNVDDTASWLPFLRFQAKEMDRGIVSGIGFCRTGKAHGLWAHNKEDEKAPPEAKRALPFLEEALPQHMEAKEFADACRCLLCTARCCVILGEKSRAMRISQQLERLILTKGERIDDGHEEPHARGNPAVLTPSLIAHMRLPATFEHEMQALQRDITAMP